MTIQYINTGTSPNAGNGDSLRVAFSKINSNFSELYGASSVGFPSQIGHEGQFLTTDGGNLSWASVTSSGGGSGGTSTVIVSNVAPDNPVLGELWYDDISGRLYVWYDTFWVDASPRGNNVVSSLINGTYTFALSTSGSVSLNGTVFTGLSGPSGPQGNTGQGFNFRGAWSTTTSYVPYDVVTFGGGSFVNILATTSTNGPFTVYWNQIAAGGSPGAPGPTGPTGPSGPTGLLGILSTLTNGSYTASLDNSGNLIVPGGVYATGLYSSSGASVGNSSLIEGDTSAMTIPANGASDPLQLYNFYGPVTITSGVDNAHTEQWTFGTDGSLTIPTGGKIQDGNNYLTTSNLEIQGHLKGVDGSTGSTGQVLTRNVNGGVYWADATGGGSSNSDGGFADNSAGITITTYTLATDTGSYDNSGSVTYNIASTGATSAGIIIKGITANHTQTITGDFNQGDNTVSWGQSGIDYQLWGQMASVTAYVVDSRGYTFYTVVTDLWDVPHGPCLVEGTMITMANGTHKAIEDITPGELIRVWNFDLGEFSEAQPIWIKVEEETTGHDVYTFSDGTQLRTVGHHVFNKQAGAFTKLKLAETPVGTTTFNEQGLEVTLISKERVIEPTCYYNVWTQYHLNLFADGILTSNRFNNIYPIVDMKFVKDDRALRSVEEFAGIDEKYINGLRLREQPEEYTAEYIADYVHNRLERLDIANQVEQGI